MPRDEKKHCRKGSGSKGRDGGVHSVHAQGIGILDGGCALKCEFLVIYIFSHIHIYMLLSVFYCMGLHGDNCMGLIFIKLLTFHLK